jgi:hypothetical protein
MLSMGRTIVVSLSNQAEQALPPAIASEKVG